MNNDAVWHQCSRWATSTRFDCQHGSIIPHLNASATGPWWRWRSAGLGLWNSRYSKGGRTSKGKAHEKLMRRCQVISMRPRCRSPLVWLEHFWQVSQAEQSSAGMWSTKDVEGAQDTPIPLPVRLSRGGLPLSEDVQEWRTEINARARARADKISLLPSFKWLTHPEMKFCHHLLSLMSFQYGLYDLLSSLEHKRRC